MQGPVEAIVSAISLFITVVPRQTYLYIRSAKVTAHPTDEICVLKGEEDQVTQISWLFVNQTDFLILDVRSSVLSTNAL